MVGLPDPACSGVAACAIGIDLAILEDAAFIGAAATPVVGCAAGL